MNLITQTATTLLGLLAGGMVLIATGLVPYWRAIDPSEFTNAFAPSLPTVGGTMIVLTVLGTGMIVIAAGLELRKSQPNRFLLAGSALAALIMLATLPLYFGAANPLLAGGTLSAEAITDELATWQQMHWFRTIVGVVGLFLAVRAGYLTEKVE